MENIFKKEVKKSDLDASSEFDFHQILQKHENLMDCKILRDEDKINFEFLVNEAKPYTEIKSFSYSYKYQALINIAGLAELAKKVSFDINPENLYFGINMMPKVMMRDVYKDKKYDEEEFVKAYKSLIGYVLNGKYSFDNYYKGGEKLLSKAKFTEPYSNLNSVENIYKTLIEEFKKYEKEKLKTKIEVNKSKFRNMKYFRRIGSVMIIILAIVCGYFGLFIIPENNAVIEGNESYVKQDYINTIESLKDIKVERLSANSKYIYAVSYIKTDALSDEQKNNILASVAIYSNEKILNYWIYLSKNNYNEAIDIAKQLGNKEYLLYGYMKKKSYIESDGLLSGQERETQLKEVESNIKDLTNNGIKGLNAEENTQGNKE